MTSPMLAQDTKHGRMYARERGGEPRHPSITTVLDTYNQHMEWWEARCTAEAALGKASSLAKLASLPESPEKWDEKKQAFAYLTGAAERDRNDAAARGDLVHNYAETYALLQIGKATEKDLARQEWLCKNRGDGSAASILPHFHRFWDDWKPRVVAPEATVWNETVGYAGTTDILFSINTPSGREVNIVGDYKTKKGLFYRGKPKSHDLRDYTGMQLAAAANAEEIWVSDVEGDRWEPMTFKADIGIAIALAPDGYVVRQYDIWNPSMFGTFKALREAWSFRDLGEQMMSGRLLGPQDLMLD